MVRWLGSYSIGHNVRSVGALSHQSKAGTPTMGGALILVSILISALLWSNLHNRYVWIVVIVTVLFGIIGWVDDYKKLILKNSKGLAARTKYFWQSVIGLTVA